MTCTGNSSGTLAHMRISFSGKNCPLCNVFALYKRAKEQNLAFAKRLIELELQGIELEEVQLVKEA
jgi:hypothetical protein